MAREPIRSHVRVDGPAKVTGTATFANDTPIPNLAWAATVTSSIARGRITSFELDQARKTEGVLGIFTYHDLAGAIQPVKHLMSGGYANSSALPLGSAEILYGGQIVALVVAEWQEAAEEAASRVIVRYQTQSATGDLGFPGAERVRLSDIRPAHKDPTLNDAKQQFQLAPVKVDRIYTTPIQHHNPIELFGTTCVWEGDHLTVYEPTRYIDGMQHGLAAQLGIDAGKIRVICPFIGGHFGSKLALSQYTAPVAIAARRLNRPVRYVASREECFTIANHRPDTRHHIQIGSTKDGEFTSLIHEAESTTSRFDDFLMTGTDVTSSLYAWRSVETKETMVRVDRNTPGPMRAPPEVPYLFALETAIDEVATELAIDPVELRKRNDAAIDPITRERFAPRKLKQCFDEGAKAFGWSHRNTKPASLRDGEWLVGHGCATSVRPVKRAAAIMRVALSANGKATIGTAHHEIGNGIYTVLAIEAAEHLGTDIESVTVHLGDTALPAAGISGGSSTTTSLVPALRMGCDTIRNQLAQAVITNRPGFAHFKPKDFSLVKGFIVSPGGTSVKTSEAFAMLGKSEITTLAEAKPKRAKDDIFAKLRQGKLNLAPGGDEVKWAYGAQFAEVRVHTLTGEVRVPRLIGAFSAGYIINRLTALSQLRGAMIWGIGAALLEATVIDPSKCRYVNGNLSDYLVPTAADNSLIEAILLDQNADSEDLMGLGELGIIGVNAAIANALFNATGKRFRNLPIRVEDTLEALASL